MKEGIIEIRNALSTRFNEVVFCLLPMSFAYNMPWSKEEEFLENLYEAVRTSAGLASNLLLKTKKSTYSLIFDGAKMHKRIWVDFVLKRKLQTCEIGDVLIISKYVDPHGVLSRNVCFLQVKASDKKRRSITWKIDKKQLDFYMKWPRIQTCYTGRAFKNVLLQNLRLSHKNRLFSPYLLVKRNWQGGRLCGVSSWITGPDLVTAASKTTGKMKGPLELSFLSYLIQLLFQTTGEKDIYNYKSKNKNLTRVVSALLQYVKLHDPPEGEGRPFLVVTLTVKKSAEPK